MARDLIVVPALGEAPQLPLEALVPIVDRELRDRARDDARSQPGGGARIEGRVAVRAVGRVPAPQLVAAVSAHDDLDVPGGQPREEVRGQKRRVGHGLVQLVERVVEHVEEGAFVERLADELDVEPFGHEARVLRFVERGVLEADREGLHAASGGGRERRHARRVDTAAEKDPDGHVGDELGLHGAPELAPQLRRELGVSVRGRRRGRADAPVSLRLFEVTVGPDERVSGRQLAHAAYDGLGCVRVVGEEV